MKNDNEISSLSDLPEALENNYFFHLDVVLDHFSKPICLILVHQMMVTLVISLRKIL